MKSKIIYWGIFITLLFYQMYNYIKNKIQTLFKYKYKPIYKEKEDV